MLGPSYAGNKTGDTRIARIHHLITAEGFLSWKHSNLALLIKALLCALPTSSNRLFKRRFTHPCVYLLTLSLPVTYLFN